LSSGGQSTQAFPDFNNIEGWAQCDEAILGSYVASGSGILSHITFKAKNIGESSLTFDTVDLRDLDNDPISATIENGTVTVGEVLAKVKIWLEGPYQAGGSMTTSLNTGGYIPTTSPYSDGRTVSSVPNGITDWIFVELRSTPGGTAVGRESFFIKSDGNIADIDGSTTDLAFGGVADGNYYIVVKHLNHLAVMSANAVALNGLSAALYDFTSGSDKYYGAGGVKELESGVWGMYGGDCNQDGNITVADNNIIMNNRNDEGYEDGDINLDGNVTVADNNKCMNNRNKGTQVP
ncbi:MAG: hypothetical protein L6422_06615, partial [Candidatus Marinimicrobia bacterium]|nr:hypothetical protein [bacterium]MCG2715941.1 hypothetical protein [Candidatus Neomarinimicrobiota bacterium]